MAFGNFGKRPGAPAPAAPPPAAALAPRLAPAAAPAARPAFGGARPIAARPAPAPIKPKWGGVGFPQQRDPMLEVGDYRLRLDALEPHRNPGSGLETIHFVVTVVDVLSSLDTESAPETVAKIIEITSGEAAQYGMPRAKAGIVGFSGADPSEFDAFDPEGAWLTEIIERDPTCLIGRFVDCRVTRGKDTPDGSDWYRQHQYGAVDESEQTVPSPFAAA